MDSTLVLAVAVVFISNALVVVGLGWVAYHIQQSTEQMQSRLDTATRDLLEAGRGLRGLGAGVDRVIERLVSAERQTSAMLRAGADSMAAMDGRFQASHRAALGDLHEQLEGLRAAQQARAASDLAREDAERQALLARQAQERVHALDEELAALRATHAQLQGQHASQLDQLRRMAVEKDFIEDRFLGLEAEANGGADV